MPTKLLALLPALAGVALFLTGALNRPAPEPAPPPEPAFVPQSVPLSADVAKIQQDAGKLLGRAIECVAPERVTWLHVRVWQLMTDDDAAFESEGTLQLGPRHCARLDVSVRTEQQTSRLLVVSDGHAIAQVVHRDAEAPVVTSQLVNADPAAGGPLKSPAEVLREHGCGGPYPLLCDLRNRLKGIEAQAGLWKERAVVRLKGHLEPGQVAGETCPTVVPDFCYLYMDAQSLWPHGVEWWGTDRRQRRRPLLRVEFRDPEVNRPLSLPECMRAFSYQPG